MSKIAEAQRKVEAYKLQKEAELDIKKANLGANIQKKEKKTMKDLSTPEVHRLHKSHRNWAVIMLSGGMGMMIVSLGLFGIYTEVFPRDIWAGFLWWMFGMFLMGIGFLEAMRCWVAKNEIDTRALGEKSVPLDEKT